MRVISNTAISLDGRINTREGRFTTLGSTQDHKRMGELRDEADAVLVGGATFRNWPHPSLPGTERDAAAPPLWNVIVSRSLKVPLLPEFLKEPRIRPLFVTLASSLPADFPAEVEAYDGPGDDIPVPFILKALQRRGVKTLLVEAGGDLLYQFLDAGALDEMFVTLCPKVIGGRGVPSLVDGHGFTFAELRSLRLRDLKVHGDELFLHYAVDRS
jgi:riboflavin-specific deaminase-like protein